MRSKKQNGEDGRFFCSCMTDIQHGKGDGPQLPGKSKPRGQDQIPVLIRMGNFQLQMDELVRSPVARAGYQATLYDQALTYPHMKH